MNKNVIKVSTLSAALLLTLSIAQANPVTVLNQDFNLQPQAPGATTVYTGGGLTDWAVFNVGSGGNWDVGLSGANGSDFTDPLTAPASPVDNYLWINRFNGDGTQVAGVYQDVGAFLANTTYTLTVAIGSRGDRINSPGIISLLNGTDNTGTVLATGGGLPATQNSWQDYTASFTTGASVSGDLVIDLSVLDAGTIQAGFSNVRLDAVPVPEPSTYALLGGGLVSLLAFRRLLAA